MYGNGHARRRDSRENDSGSPPEAPAERDVTALSSTITASPVDAVPAPKATGKTIIVFSGDLDRAIAAFIIANGAAAMGDPVTMFFTFWGLEVLRKPEAPPHDKKVLQEMFASLMAKGPDHLGLSKMNFGGMGASMMKRVMREEHVMSLDDLIASARGQGVRMIACTMSMGVLGFKEDEFIDGIEFAGVGTYLGAADEANVNLFI